jgi:hypothetical protein
VLKMSQSFFLDANLETQSLPFSVSIASQEDMHDVARVRAMTYGKHLKELGLKLSKPESDDHDVGCEVLIARSKLDDSILGTLRTHANVLKPVPLQASVDLPHMFDGTKMVEATRLCVLGSENSSVVRAALFKALFLYCISQKSDWIMAVGRRPVDRIYDSMFFADVLEKNAFYPMSHVGGIPHRAVYFSVPGAQKLWAERNHPLYKFVFETVHPDIDLSAAQPLSADWSTPSSKPKVTPFRKPESNTPADSWDSNPVPFAA